jgi:hypothetical protein
MMGMAYRDRQRIGSVGPCNHHSRQLQADHMIDLTLVGVADTDHRFLDGIRGILAHIQTGLRRNEQSDAAGLPKLQCCNGVFIDEGLFDCRVIGTILPEYFRQLGVQREQSLCKIIAG